jgi:hypothetical protein
MPAQTGSGLLSSPGHIHPIMEADEEEFQHALRNNEPITPTSDSPSDPFVTPSATAVPLPLFATTGRGSATPSPEAGTRRIDPDVQDWVSDVDASDGLLARRQGGRISPTRRNSHRSGAALRDDDSRTGSGLSEASNRSDLRMGRRGMASSLLGGSTLAHTDINKPGSSSSSSYNTAKSTFGALQQEGPNLLMGGSTSYSAGQYQDDSEEPQQPGSPSKSKPRRGWLGSIRRAFSVSGRSTPGSSNESRDGTPSPYSWEQQQQHQHGGTSEDVEPQLVGLSGELLRRKQGRRDWEFGTEVGEQTEWDIERAVEQRMVQVMFTVPKERLRVVNAADDDQRSEEEDVASAGDTAPGPTVARPQTAEFVDPEKESLCRRQSEAEMNDAAVFDDSKGDLGVRSEEPSRDRDPEKHGLLLHAEEASRRLSAVTDDSDRRSSGVMCTAQAMTMERPGPTVTVERSGPPPPRTSRVLRMVASIESGGESSREGSPTRVR